MFQNPCLYAISFVTIWDKVNKLIIYLNNDNLKTVFPARAKKKKKKSSGLYHVVLSADSQVTKQANSLEATADLIVPADSDFSLSSSFIFFYHQLRYKSSYNSTIC